LRAPGGEGNLSSSLPIPHTLPEIPVPPIARSILAIVAGFLFIGALSFGTDAALISAGLYPPHPEPVMDVGRVLLAAAYVAVFAIAGCWLAASLAPNRPMLHALILGVLGLAFNVAGAAATWGQSPTWAVALNLLLVMPYAWIGGRLRERQVAQRLAVS
jgi:hypothetical protein